MRARAREGRRISAHPRFADAAETKSRAQRRIGEYSKTLEKVQTVGGGNVGMPTSGKRDTLKSAGLSIRAAIRPGAA